MVSDLITNMMGENVTDVLTVSSDAMIVVFLILLFFLFKRSVKPTRAELYYRRNVEAFHAQQRFNDYKRDYFAKRNASNAANPSNPSRPGTKQSQARGSGKKLSNPSQVLKSSRSNYKNFRSIYRKSKGAKIRPNIFTPYHPEHRHDFSKVNAKSPRHQANQSLRKDNDLRKSQGRAITKKLYEPL